MAQDDGKLHDITLQVNGQEYSATIPARRTLLDFLREGIGLTGTKKVCDMGHCGACTVNRNGKPVLSCLTLAALCDGDEITTIEGVAAMDGTLSSVQRAFIEHDGLQCGFCTPGQIMSATALLAENPAPSEREVRDYMAGNLCRCGAYAGIVDAVMSVARGDARE